MRIVLIAAGIFLLAACQKSTGNNATQSVPAAVMPDLSYGSDTRQKMDVYLPAGRSTDSTKLVILIHGGGWNEGDKADFNGYASALQKLLPDYAIVNINYRLALNGQNLFPAQEEDVKAAAAYVFSKRQAFRISDKWAYIGASAGGHLALLQSYKYSSPVKPKAVVSFFGPSDLKALYNLPNPLYAISLAGVTGTTPLLNPALYQESSPINYVTVQSPPTMVLQGGADPIVPPVQSTTLRDKLQSLEVPLQYVFYPNNGHGWTGADLTDSLTKIAAFLKEYMQ